MVPIVRDRGRSERGWAVRRGCESARCDYGGIGSKRRSGQFKRQSVGTVIVLGWMGTAARHAADLARRPRTSVSRRPLASRLWFASSHRVSKVEIVLRPMHLPAMCVMASAGLHIWAFLFSLLRFGAGLRSMELGFHLLEVTSRTESALRKRDSPISQLKQTRAATDGCSPCCMDARDSRRSRSSHW
jgi:hypothetical protein